MDVFFAGKAYRREYEDTELQVSGEQNIYSINLAGHSRVGFRYDVGSQIAVFSFTK